MTSEQPYMQAIHGVCEGHRCRTSKYSLPQPLSGHPRYALNTGEGAADRGNDRFGDTMREGSGPPGWKLFHVAEFSPRFYNRFDRAIEMGAHQQRRVGGTLAITVFRCRWDIEPI